MKKLNRDSSQSIINEKLCGVVDRVTYHNQENGWSVLRITPFGNFHQKETVTVHQTKVFAGATMEFTGSWTFHPKFGRQFKAMSAVERKPATSAALEKYLGSGLIKGVGPKTAKRIVGHFGVDTLDVFENDIDHLLKVPGIAHKKLKMIANAWSEHRSIRDVMMFLQSHGVSTLYAVRIYKEYGDNAISYVTADPYRLAVDFYGIGFFSADRIALSIGLSHDSPQRIMAAIKHVLSASREFGHCFLTISQIEKQVKDLIGLEVSSVLPGLLGKMEKDGLLMIRYLMVNDEVQPCYYSKSLYFDELYAAKKISAGSQIIKIDQSRVENWLSRFCAGKDVLLSSQQANAVKNIVSLKFSILTGGPGCGKTTATLVLVKLLQAMNMKVLLAAPTGRAAQRMTDVVGLEAKTIHRLLEWQFGSFARNEESPLDLDFLIVDECSMLDINLTASLLKAVPENGQVLFIGDADQLPSVGAGNVLHDLISSGAITCFNLTEIFRQARESLIIRYAHQINSGDIPYIDSPFKKPEIWKQGCDCIFLDSEEATKEQLGFIARVKKHFDHQSEDCSATNENPYEFRTNEAFVPYEAEFKIPHKFQHVDINTLLKAENRTQEMLTVIKKIHPWSSLFYSLSAVEVVKKLYIDWIPKYHGNCEIQILSPMTRGSLGTVNLNNIIQDCANPLREGMTQIKVGERSFRVGDRVIHRKNNYDLGVFNGDIGVISSIDLDDLTCTVKFYPDSREVLYQREHIIELDLAYAITIHKSQGSEFEAVIIPVLSQHFKMLFRNLIYTGLTRARKFVAFVGSRKSLAMAVKNQDTTKRQTALQELLKEKMDFDHNFIS